MNALVSFLLVVGLVLIAAAGTGAAGLQTLFGVVVPYVAILVFLLGFVRRIVIWARAPVPFRIPTTAGQQKALDFLPYQPLENPPGAGTTFLRMVLEVLCFRSLFRNTRAEMREGPRLVYASRKWLWLGGLVFHWAFLLIVLRHLRFFTEPVPGFAEALERVDGFFEVLLPELYVTDLAILVALTYLVLRRFLSPPVRYISQAADYFPLFLIVGVVLSGAYLRYLSRTDIVAVKALGMGLLSFHPDPAALRGVGAQFYVHLFLVCTLIAYFPFSKLMHLGGVFLSPTRNLANTNRLTRHVNPWNPPLKGRTFEDWMEDFKEEIAQAGYKLERD